MKGKAYLSLKPFKDVKDNKMDFYRYIGSGRQKLMKGTEKAGSSYAKSAVSWPWSLCLVVEFG